MPVKKKVTVKKATKTTKKKVERVVKKDSKKQSGFASIVESLRLGESYTSLVLGIIAVVVATILLLTFVHNRQDNLTSPDATPTLVQSNSLAITPTVTQAPTPAQNIISGQKTYTVVAGDNLWKIAEAEYHNGYNWVDIARANNLANPSDIHVGNKLIIPQVALKDATVHTADDDRSTDYQPHKIVDQTYTVVFGDDLWDIAVRAYGDGYQWVKIAKANNLENPDYIHVGNVLKIPRN